MTDQMTEASMAEQILAAAVEEDEPIRTKRKSGGTRNPFVPVVQRSWEHADAYTDSNGVRWGKPFSIPVEGSGKSNAEKQESYLEEANTYVRKLREAGKHILPDPVTVKVEVEEPTKQGKGKVKFQTRTRIERTRVASDGVEETEEYEYAEESEGVGGYDSTEFAE